MRNIIITGASGGLAQALVKGLREDRLFLFSRDKKKLEALYGHLEQVYFYQVDIRDDQALEGIIDKIQAQYGQIDLLINNAGYGIFRDFDQISAEESRDILEINTLATIHLSRIVGKQMKENRSGQIINIVSMAGHIATSKSSIYSASKFALIGYSNALRLELAPFDVIVTTVNPGPIATDFFDQADPTGNYLESVSAFVLSPDYVAQKIIQSMGKKKREINLPRSLRLAKLFYQLFPSIGDFLAIKVFNYK